MYPIRAWINFPACSTRKKTIYAKVTYVDIAGLDGSSGHGGISGALLNQLTQLDGFIHVVRVL